MYMQSFMSINNFFGKLRRGIGITPRPERGEREEREAVISIVTLTVMTMKITAVGDVKVVSKILLMTIVMVISNPRSVELTPCPPSPRFFGSKFLLDRLPKALGQLLYVFNTSFNANWAMSQLRTSS